MEVRPGYKQTEVGVIPVEWETVRLANVSAFITKGSTPTTYGFGWQSSGVLFLRSECVSAEGLDLAQSMFISAEAHRALRRSAVQSNDLLITITGNVGRVVTVPGDVGEANINQHIARIRIVDDSTHPGWVYHFLSQPGVRQHFEKITTGQAYPQISLVQVRDAVIPHPTIAEQRAIAAALSDADALLGGLDRLIAKKRDLKQAAMQQLLTGQTRLPGFSGEWGVKRLRDLCTLKSGESITAKSIDDISSFPCYGGNGLRGFTSRFTHEGDYCLIGRVGALCGNLSKVTGQFFASEHAIVATAFEDVDVGWLTLALGTLNLNRRAESSAQPVLTVSKLLPLEILAPSTKDEQTAIVEVLSDMDAELSTLEARRDKTRDLKQAMMQDLLTGKTRLVAAGVAHA